MDELLFEFLKNFAGSAGSTLGQQATTSALQALGLGTAGNQTDFETNVQKSLKTLSQQMTALANALSAIGIADATIREQIADAALQALKTDYAKSANTIDTYFETYTLFSGNVASTNGDKSAIDQLYNFLTMPGADIAVATEMRNINTFLVGQDEVTGLIAYQHPHAYAAIDTYVAVPGNWVHQVNGLSNFPDNAMLLQKLCDASAPNGSLETSILDDVIPAMKNALLAQSRGLAFLTAIWGNGPQQPQLVEFTNNIVAQATAMKTMMASLTDFDGNATAIMNSSAIALTQGDINNFRDGGNVQGWPGIWWSAMIDGSSIDSPPALQPGYFFNMPGTPFNLTAQVMSGPFERFYGNFVAINIGSNFPDYEVVDHSLHVVVVTMPSGTVSSALTGAAADFVTFLDTLIQAGGTSGAATVAASAERCAALA
jgi:hypothetical protein